MLDTSHPAHSLHEADPTHDLVRDAAAIVALSLDSPEASQRPASPDLALAAEGLALQDTRAARRQDILAARAAASRNTDLSLGRARAATGRRASGHMATAASSALVAQRNRDSLQGPRHH
jgi:hypothetical protein